MRLWHHEVESGGCRRVIGVVASHDALGARCIGVPVGSTSLGRGLRDGACGLVASGAPLVAGPLVHVTMTVPGGVPSTSAFEVASSVVAGDGGATVGNAGLLIAGVEAAR